MSLTPQSAQEFSDARRRAFIEKWFGFFQSRPKDLLSFEEVRRSLRLFDSSYKGLQEIELDKIVGSVGRYRDFTRTFLPKESVEEDRWRRVDAVAHNLGFPPIEVYKVGDAYFVRDGNHRVSVARTHGAKTIEAYVIEYKTAVPLENSDELDDILLKMGRTEFLEQTRLDRIRLGHTVEFTEPGRYRLLLDYIAVHKYLKETECGCEITYEEAVASWYDTEYLPMFRLIRECGILTHFPGRTEADLYMWLVAWRAELENRFRELGRVSNEALLDEFARENRTPLLMRWLRGIAGKRKNEPKRKLPSPI